MQALVARDLESHPVRHSSHQVSPFRKELQLGFGRSLVHFRLATKGTQGHFVIEVARFLRFVEDGKNATVQFLVVRIILLRHPLVEEPLLGNDVVGMFRDAPIELPARIGSQLIVSAIERILQDKAAMHLSVLEFQYLAFHQIAVLIQQFCIENSA